MGLKETLTRIKRIEKSSGITERRKLQREVEEHIAFVERSAPWHIQDTLWSLVELTHDEIRGMGEGKRTLEDFKDRFKMNYLDWVRGIRARMHKPDRWTQGREIARFNAARGDMYYDYYLTAEDRRLLNLIPQGTVQ